jgi:hypothetical protein
MEPYDDASCEWNCDACCSAWKKRSDELERNNIEFEPGDDANYACTCPTCGRTVCGWCV